MATLDNIDWILRFHDALIRALKSRSCKVEARQRDRSHLVEVIVATEAGELSFAEDFEKVLHPVRDQSWGSNQYAPKGTYKLKLERPFAALKGLGR